MSQQQLPRLILVSGWKNSGKDATSDFLVYEYQYKKLAFANALKDAVAQTYNLDRALFDDRTKKEAPLLDFPVRSKDGFSKVVNEYMKREFKEVDGTLYHTPRSLCILEGSVKRSVDSNYWVDKTLAQLTPNSNFVIADWRYKSEVEAIWAAGFEPLTIRIDRFETTDSTDPSERDLDDFKFDYRLKNDGTLIDLFNLVQKTLQM